MREPAMIQRNEKDLISAVAVYRLVASIGAALGRAVILAFVADLIIDAVFGNPTVNLATFIGVLVLIVLRQYRQHVRDTVFQRRIAGRRERLMAETVRHYEALGCDQETIRRALQRCDFDRAAVMELVLADALPEQSTNLRGGS